MSRVETAALKLLVLSDPAFAAAGKLFEGRALDASGKPITNTWYVVLQPGADSDSADRATGWQLTRFPSFAFQCVGTTPDQAIATAERLDAVLRPRGVGRRLSVSDRVCGPLRRDYIGPVQIDPDISPPTWFQTVEYSFRSQPAPTS